MNKSLVAQNIKKNYQLLDNRQYGLAEQNAFNLLKNDPNNHEIYNLIGDIHYKQNNFDLAYVKLQDLSKLLFL